MTAERPCERCGTPLEGRRPDARFCGAACRRATAREREARGAPLAADPTENPAADPTENPCDDTARRAHACEDRLRTLERRLDELARQLSDADARLMARAMRDALREDGSG